MLVVSLLAGCESQTYEYLTCQWRIPEDLSRKKMDETGSVHFTNPTNAPVGRSIVFQVEPNRESWPSTRLPPGDQIRMVEKQDHEQFVVEEYLIGNPKHATTTFIVWDKNEPEKSVLIFGLDEGQKLIDACVNGV